MWPELELVQDSMTVLVTCMFHDDPIKNKDAIESTTFSPLSVYGNNFCRSNANYSAANNPIWPIISLWELLVAMETSILIRSATKPYAAFSPSH